MMQISPKLIEDLKAFLGTDGINFFKECKKEYETVSPIFEFENEEGGIIYHPVMWHEGLAVKTFLKNHEEVRTLPEEELDNFWIFMVDLAIE